MRLTVEKVDGTHYLDFVLNKKDREKLDATGLCAEFYGTGLEDLFLNIFIRKEENEGLYATKEGPIKQSSLRERKRVDGDWTTTETGCSDCFEDSWEIKKTEKEIIDELSQSIQPRKRGRPRGSKKRINNGRKDQ